MLQQLSIKNLALIDSLDLEFGPGLNIVTGETGAGKSILIGALSLVLGERADRDKIRRGAERCEISALFQLSPDLLAVNDDKLEASGVSLCEDGALLVKRVIASSGSRCFLNGSSITAQALRQFGDLLVEVHGPYEHQALLQPSRQLELLDAYASLDKERLACNTAWTSLQEAKAARIAAEQDVPSAERRDVLRFQLDEIEDARLSVDEELELQRRHQTAANAGELIALSSSAVNLLDRDGGVSNQMEEVARLVEQLATLDGELASPIAARLEVMHEELADLSRELAESSQELDLDPASLRELEDRVALLQKLKRKYGGSIERVMAHGEKIGESLHRMEHYDELLIELDAAVATAESKYRTIATKLTRKRKTAAPKLAKQIGERLRHLGFASAEFTVELVDGTPLATGLDRADMHFAPNPGEGLRPLRQIASSGEIARVMLAIKAVLASNDATPLLVFDEVDANVGGEVANRVGAQMRRIAGSHQVLCISHLPQVAAAAHHHYCVAKEVCEDRTFARIYPLDETARIDELARMLGGKDTSSVVLDHAQQLIAAQEKDG